MSKEKLYFLEIVLPKEENEYLRHVTEKISNETNSGNQTNYDFHLTIEEPLYCSSRAIRVDLNEWLKMQDPFEFTLDEVGNFKNRKNGLVYLTTTSKDEKIMISDLHYNVHEIIKSNSPYKQNNSKYIPHVTLLRDIPLEKINEIREKFLSEVEPFKVSASEILVRERYNDSRWEDFRRFSFGGDSIFSCQSD